MCPKQTVKNSKIKNTNTSSDINDVKEYTSNKSSCTKTFVRTVIKEEMGYISNLFNLVNLSTLVHGKRNLIEEDDDDEMPTPMDIPEEKIFQKHKKNSAQPSSKVKSFPKSIDGLQKELDELKGLATMTYQQKIRKKGLQSRLVKKKRKELKTSVEKKRSITVNGQIKFIKPVLNSEGNVVNNKFDFAESEVKNEKRERNDKHSHAKKMFNVTNADDSVKMEVQSVCVKKESLNIENSAKNNKPLFNKDNKMVFSRVFIPEDLKKTKGPKDPKKILEKIKENSKKISVLEKEDKEKASKLREKQKWSSALKRASGETIRDDPELLRKSIAREKNQKVRSEKKWKARLDQVQKDKDDRQKKRTANIQARKNEKKKKKTKKAIKKGRIIQV